MKNTKLFIVSLLALSILLCMSLSLFAGSDVTGEFKCSDNNVVAGDVLKVDLAFSEKVTGVSFKFVYDHTKLELVGVKSYSTEGDCGQKNDDKDIVFWYSTPEAKPLYAEFKVKEGVKAGDKLTIGAADLTVGDEAYNEVSAEIKSWETTILSGETGFNLIVTVYKTSADRTADKNGKEFTVKSSDLTLDDIPATHLYYKITVKTVDDDASAKLDVTTGKLTAGKASTVKVTVTAANGNTKTYNVTIKTATCTHNYEEVDGTYVAPTCTKEGSVKKKCTICGYTKTFTISKKPHEYENTVVAATCDEGGYTLHKCKVCAYEYKSDPTEALGHSFEAVSSTTTCKVLGETTFKCTVCQVENKVADTELLAHKYASKVIEATCTESGKTVHTCEVCSESYEDAIVPAKGHAYKPVETKPTCTTAGYTTFTCEACNHSYVDNYVSAAGHKFGEWKTELAPTSEKDGIAKRTCSVCSESETQVIPKLLSGTQIPDPGEGDGTDWTLILIIILIIGIIILIVLLLVVYFTYKKKKGARGGAPAPKKKPDAPAAPTPKK